MFGLIERIREEGPGILLVEQNVVQSLQRRLARLSAGERRASRWRERPLALLDDPQLKKAYLGL